MRLAGERAGEPHARFDHAIEIAVPRQRVREVLASLEALSPLHPLIESITALPARAIRPKARRYRVVDQIPVGPWRLRAVYTAELEVLAEDHVRGEAWQSPGVHLVTDYRLDERRAGPPETGPDDRGRTTALRESVAIWAPFGLRRFVARQASDSHRVTLEKLKALLERDG